MNNPLSYTALENIAIIVSHIFKQSVRLEIEIDGVEMPYSIGDVWATSITTNVSFSIPLCFYLRNGSKIKVSVFSKGNLVNNPQAYVYTIPLI